MSYFINRRKLKDGAISWRLLRNEFKGGKRLCYHVPSDQLLQHGLSPTMTLEEAAARVKQLNAQARGNKDDSRKKARALARLKKQEQIESAHLPKSFVAEFEQDYLKAEIDIGPTGPYKYRRSLFHWQAAKRFIAAVNLPQQHWYQHRRRFYNELQKAKYSLDYVGKILRVLNLWGAFIAVKTGGSYIPVPRPKGYDRNMIADSFRMSGKKSKESEAITPEHLAACDGKLKPEQWRWLYVSVWLGLRPAEVDGLSKRVIISEQRGVKVLSVYQPKLAGVKEKDRYKYIPLICPEQVACLEIVKQGIERPLVKTVEKHVLRGANLYGGRKGFVALMKSKGQRLENISAWLGHTSLDRTVRDYTDKTIVHFDKVG